MNDIGVLDLISQIGIALTSIVSIKYLASKEYRKGFLISILGQPFWLYSTISNKQYGMLIVTVYMTYNFARGYLNHVEN